MQDRLLAYSPRKFNTWICVYLNVVFQCDVRILDSLLLHYPLILDWGTDLENQTAAMRRLYVYLSQLLWTMHKADEIDRPYEMDGNELQRRLVFLTKAGQYKIGYERLRIWWWVDYNRISISYRQKTTENRKVHHYLIFWCTEDPGHICPARLLEPFHLCVWQQKTKTGDDGEEDIIQTLMHECLQSFRYPSQIRRFLLDFMNAAPEYWEDKKLPKTLKI